jgi:hypothetical protein
MVYGFSAYADRLGFEPTIWTNECSIRRENTRWVARQISVSFFVATGLTVLTLTEVPYM